MIVVVVVVVVEGIGSITKRERLDPFVCARVLVLAVSVPCPRIFYFSDYLIYSAYIVIPID